MTFNEALETAQEMRALGLHDTADQYERMADSIFEEEQKRQVKIK